MAAATCYYHPDQVSSTACAQCGVPLCSGCVETVANQPVCRSCVGAIRARVAAEINAAPQPPGLSQPNPFPPQGQAMPANPFMPQGQALPPQAVQGDAGRLMLGILAGAVVAVIGSVIWEKIYWSLHFGLSLIYLGVGYAAAWALVKASGRSGGAMAPLALAVTLFGLMAGHVLLTYDATGVVSMPAFLYVCEHLGALHWVCVALGLYGAYRRVEQHL